MKVAWINQTKWRKIVAILADSAVKFGHTPRKFTAADDYSDHDVVISFGNTPVNISPGQVWLHVDGAYWGRPNYFRITKDAFQPHKYLMNVDCPSDRWEQLGIELKPWRSGGDYILICKVSDRNEKFLGFNMQADLDNAISVIEKQTDLEIKIREKADKWSTPFSKELENAYAVVTWASTTSVEAVVNGTPVYVLIESASSPVAGDLHDIKNPYKPDREQWACNLAYQQWNRKEIHSGEAWKHFIEDSDWWS